MISELFLVSLVDIYGFFTKGLADIGAFTIIPPSKSAQNFAGLSSVPSGELTLAQL
jgi:hypothetical protein